MTVGMAVNSGMQQQKAELANVLECAAQQAIGLGLWVEGKPFDVTLRQVANQLVDQTGPDALQTGNGDTHPKTEEHVEECPSCQLIDEMDGIRYNPLTPGEWWMIADEIKAETGLATEVEGGGAACPFIDITLPDGRIIWLCGISC